jgi:hypothetical protein
MHLRRFTRLVLFTMAAMTVLPGMASANIIFTVGQTYNGVTPVGAAPWARATFADIGSNKVKLSMENLATGSAGQFITNWTFNVSDEGFLGGLKFTYKLGDGIGSNKAVHIDVDANDVDALGGGDLGKHFDIGFDFETANKPSRFTPGETSVYEIEYTGSKGPFTASLFDAVTSEDLYTSIKVQGIPKGECSSGSGAATVPEPSSLALWSLLGVAGIGVEVVRRRRRVKD